VSRNLRSECKFTDILAEKQCWHSFGYSYGVTGNGEREIEKYKQL